jgi:hypothetical protein
MNKYKKLLFNILAAPMAFIGAILFWPLLVFADAKDDFKLWAAQLTWLFLVICGISWILS